MRNPAVILTIYSFAYNFDLNYLNTILAES